MRKKLSTFDESIIKADSFNKMSKKKKFVQLQKLEKNLPHSEKSITS